MTQDVVPQTGAHRAPTTSRAAAGEVAQRVDVRGLERALRQQIAGEVRFDRGSRALYAADASNYRQAPVGVVIPQNRDDIIQTVALCRQFGAPVLARGGGTALAGQTCNVAVILDMSKYYHQILELDAKRQQARVQPGIILDTLRDAAEKYHLTFGPDPATHDRCTLGGMIGNDSCGTHSVMAGKTVDNIDELEILLYDGTIMRVGATSDAELTQIIQAGGRKGEIYAALKALRDRYGDAVRQEYPNIPRRVSGYNLDQLLPEKGFHVARALVGSEGTCVTILEATTKLVHSPPARSLLALGYDDVTYGCDHIPEMLAHHPIALEGMDDQMIADMQKLHLYPAAVATLPAGHGWLLVEFGAATIQESAAQARGLMDALKHGDNPPSMKLYENAADAKEIWQLREAALGATAFAPAEPPAWPGWEDSAVPPDKTGPYLRDLRKLLIKYGYRWAFYGHFGQGCVHTRISFDLASHAGIQQFRAFMAEAADLCVSYGGSLSGEHGDGQARAELLPKMYGPDVMRALWDFKTIWDPENKMNPGKMVHPYRMDENLRLGEQYQPTAVQTYFRYPHDAGSFAHATLRCVGVGKCRRLDGGTMCPSFMVTREEQDSTRGRAHLLFEMLRGDPLQHTWKNKAVKDALDLCLACKGCKGDCPVNVDMATYKAEFLAHYYQGKLRPRSAYSMGQIAWWARLAAIAPELANAVTHAPGLRRVVKALAGVDQRRSMPRFAPQTFRQWWRLHMPQNIGQQQVILWADTFNNHFEPEVCIAAVEVLEAAGFHVTIPQSVLCCGRPLYDFGFMDQAKGLLRQILTTLRHEIQAGIPIVGLEPSCIAVLRDELLNLFPNDPDAQRLAKQSFLFSEFLEQHTAEFPLPHLERPAIVQGHCHHKAIMTMHDEQAALTQMELDYTILDSGCCGMAGAFGYEPGDHYDISVKAGERVLLPAVRDAPKETLIIADGFSCRSQIAQLTDRAGLHLAQVIQMALREGTHGAMGPYPERGYTQHPRPRWGWLRATGALSVGLGMLGGGFTWFWRRRMRFIRST